MKTNALHALGAWLLCNAVWFGLGGWMAGRLRKRWHEMSFLAKLTALFLAAPVVLAILLTLLGSPAMLDAIRSDHSTLVSMAAGDGAMMGIAYGLIFCLLNPILTPPRSARVPKRDDGAPRAKVTDGSPPSQQ